MALEQNRDLRSSSLEIAKAKEKLLAGRTRLFPSFSVYALGAQQLRSFQLTIEKGVLGDYPGVGPLPSEDVFLKSPLAPTGTLVMKASQPLLSLVRIRRSLEAQKTGVEIAAEQTRADRQKVVREVKQLYYSLQQVESGLRSVQQTLALYKELERLTENYVAGEVVLKSDLLDVQTRRARTEQSRLQLNDQRELAKEQLNRLLGRDVLTEFQVQPILEAGAELEDLDAARKSALDQRPEIREAMLRDKQAHQDLRAKKAEYLPDMAAEVNNLSFLNYGRYFPSQSTSVGVSVSWEPFDWGRKKHEVAEKRNIIDQARYALQDARAAVLIDVNDKFRQLRLSGSQLHVARLAQEAAIEGLRVAKNKYAVQAVLLKDVLQGQVSLEQSNTDYQQALLSYWNARADFERAKGEDQ
jgi:outer membrane protein TolC